MVGYILLIIVTIFILGAFVEEWGNQKIVDYAFPLPKEEIDYSNLIPVDEIEIHPYRPTSRSVPKIEPPSFQIYDYRKERP